MVRIFRIVALLFICFILHEAHAQNQEITHKKKLFGFRRLDDTVTVEKQGLFILPLVYYTPDTRWAFGGAGVYYFKTPPKFDYEKLTRVSYIQFLADYTQNKQLDVWSLWNIFTRNENYLIKGELRYRIFPDRFYGVGNDSPPSNEERYEYSMVSIKNLVLKKIRPSLFIGIDYHFEYEYNFKYTEGGILEQGNITGYQGGVGSAVGAVGVYDSRDNAINARTGKLIELSTYVYTPVLGSTFSFFNINGLYQHYWPIKKKHALALQTKLRLSYGEVPFLDLSVAGGDDMLRGYPKYRYRDNHFIGTQLEYRFPLFWRLGMVAFAGIGDVFYHVSDIQGSTLKYSLGSGLRLAVNPAERLNIRFDYAIGREGGYFYFSVAESF
ncbi:MAG: outer membrane protein [Cytophagaceae bacterium]|jgi:outer membrane protein assembly factor BamA|nr:outer membrane protein [Cytophagaceae bacterium]